MTCGAGSGPVWAEICDLNNDCTNDILTANYSLDLPVANYSGGSVSVLLGSGDGTFQPAITTSTGAGCAVAKAAYLNNDTCVADHG